MRGPILGRTADGRPVPIDVDRLTHTLVEFGDSRAPARFWAKIEVAEPGCWIWTGHRLKGGYGMIARTRRLGPTTAHRFAYECLVGPIPDGQQLDHLCRTRSCVNPGHLEVVTQTENIRRGVGFGGVNYRKTRCKRGHRFTSENTYHQPDGHRRCRECAREADRRRAPRLGGGCT